MINPIIIIAVFFLYLGLLFLLALKTEQGSSFLSRLSTHPFIYAAALGIYCTTWTYYGSVGKFTTSGMLFLAIYIGPTLMIALWWVVLRKIVRIKDSYHITSIVDFISARYNRSHAVAVAGTLMVLVGVLPYIALQMKAIHTTLNEIILFPFAGSESAIFTDSFYLDEYITILLIILIAVFTIMFGARRLNPAETHKGMVLSVAIQSLIQLTAFLAAGVFIVFFMFNGFSDIFRQAAAAPLMKTFSVVGENSSGYITWASWLIIAMSAIIFLPRQFHIAVIENTDERHIKTAMWFFPLYMFLMNLFVVPIGLAGIIKGIPLAQADSYVLQLPLIGRHSIIALLVFIGGLSAAASMIMITSMTVATMVSNHLFLPLAERFNALKRLRRRVLQFRWVCIAAFIFVGFLFMRVVGSSYMLVNIGILSFVAVLQFAVPLLGGLYWRRANTAGALMGMLGGFGMWFITLFVPSLARSGWLDVSLLEKGLFGISFLNPERLFGVMMPDAVSNAVFWSLFCNIGLFVAGSLCFSQSTQEKELADGFVDVFLREKAPFPRISGQRSDINGAQRKSMLFALLSQYLSHQDAAALLRKQFHAAGAQDKKEISVLMLARICTELERELAGYIGAASAHDAFMRARIFTEREEVELSSLYGDIIARLNLTPQQLRERVDYYQEKDALLTAHAKELRQKVEELHLQIVQRQRAERAHIDSERRLQTIFSSVQAGIMLVDAAAKTVIDINPAGLRLLGFREKEDIIGRQCSRCVEIHSDARCPVIDSGHGSEAAEHIMVTAQGKRVPVFKNAVPVLLNGQQCIVESFISIEQQKKMENELRAAHDELEERVRARTRDLEKTQAAALNILEDLQEAKDSLEISRRHFLDIVEKAPVAIVVIDDKGSIPYVNPAAESLYGGADKDFIRKTLAVSFTAKEHREIEIARGGEMRTVDAYRVISEWERKAADFVFLADITERKKAQKALADSEENYRTIFEAANDAIFVFDIEKGDIIDVNEKMCELYKCTREEALGEFHISGKKDGEIPYSHKDALVYMERAAEGEPQIFEWRAEDTQGNRFWVEINLKKVRIRNVDRLLAFVRDVTDRRNAREAMERVAQEWRATFDAIGDAVSLLDAEGRVLRCNRSMAHLIGKEYLGIIGKLYSELLAPVRKIREDLLDEVKKTRRRATAEFSKEEQWYLESLDPIVDKNGMFLGAVHIIVDVTQQKQIAQNQRLVQLGTLVSHMAHEVNNPLMVISGRAQLSLMEEIVNEEVKKNLLIVMNECQRAKDIIQRLLRFSRPSKGELKTVEINKSVEEVVSLIRHQFEISNVGIMTDYTEENPLVRVDEKQIHEVVMNIFNNARDAMGKKGGTITVATSYKGGTVYIDIADTGPGISKEVLQKIFDPFFTTKQKGTGLGLSICYGIMKAHGGDLCFKSAVGEGTTATLQLPAADTKEETGAVPESGA